MPPRVPRHHLPQSTPCQSFRTRPSPQLLTDAHIAAHQNRSFHPSGPSHARNDTKLRRDMWQWLRGPGEVFRDPLKGSTNYMSAYDKRGNLLREKRSQDQDSVVTRHDVAPLEQEAEIQAREEEEGLVKEEREKRRQERATLRLQNAELDARGGLPRERPNDMRPYPMNHNFRSQPVLSEQLREELFRQVALRGIDVSTVSAAFGVDTRRVAAVVRLKTIERQWVKEGKQLAKPYHEAVLAMLPQTPFKADDSTNQIHPHEGVNDLPVHPRTREQLFWPTSESRQFTREDAAKAFDGSLLPADLRIPHPELVTLEKEHLAGIDRNERWARQQKRDAQLQELKAAAADKRHRWEERTQRVVPGRRWDFKFQDISADQTGPTGRARGAVGARYGMPHEDRKRGMVKIPTRVE